MQIVRVIDSAHSQSVRDWRGCGDAFLTFSTEIRHSKTIDMRTLTEFIEGHHQESPQECINALDVVAAQIPSASFFSTARARSFFTRNGSATLGGGAEVWAGYFQSIRPLQCGLVVNLDTTATAFREPKPVMEVLADLWGTTPKQLGSLRVDDRMRRMAEKQLRLCQVETGHRAEFRRRYRVNGLSKIPCSQLRYGATSFVLRKF